MGLNFSLPPLVCIIKDTENTKMFWEIKFLPSFGEYNIKKF